MKLKIISLFLLLSFVVPVVSTYLVLNYKKKQIKKEVKWKMISGIPKEELVLLKFTEKEKKTKLKWKHSKEFEYNGEMYDIVESNVIGDTTYYWLWWDHEETQLNKQLTKLFLFSLGQNPNYKNTQNLLYSFLKSLYYSKSTVILSCFFQNNNIFFFNIIYYQSIIIAPSLPPPKAYFIL